MHISYTHIHTCIHTSGIATTTIVTANIKAEITPFPIWELVGFTSMLSAHIRMNRAANVKAAATHPQ